MSGSPGEAPPTKKTKREPAESSSSAMHFLFSVTGIMWGGNYYNTAPKHQPELTV